MSERTQAIAEIAAPNALDIKAFGPVAPEADAVAQLARSRDAGLRWARCRVNLVPLAPAELGTAASLDEIERRIASRLLLPRLIAKIAANRMALSYIEGLIINVAILISSDQGPAQAFACVAKAALSAMTRAQAEDGPRRQSGSMPSPRRPPPAGGTRASRASPRLRTSRCSWPRAEARPFPVMCSRRSRR